MYYTIMNNMVTFYYTLYYVSDFLNNINKAITKYLLTIDNIYFDQWVTTDD